MDLEIGLDENIGESELKNILISWKLNSRIKFFANSRIELGTRMNELILLCTY